MRTITFFGFTLMCILGFAGICDAQVNQMFGLDMEGQFNLNASVQANATWVRIFVPWEQVEPYPPFGTAQPSIYGQMSGQHSYDWSNVDATVQAAVNSGLNVYVQIFWTAAWANGNGHPECNPVTANATGGQCYVQWNGSQYVQCNTTSGCDPIGNPQAAPAYIDPLSTGAAASLALEDFAYNMATRYPSVRYFGPMNEPNFSVNYYPLGGWGSPYYLDDFMNYIVWPVQRGIQAANSGNQLVGPDVSIPLGAVSGRSAFLQPLHQYFDGTFNVWSVHSYRKNNEGGVKSDVLNAASDVGYEPVWLTETGFLVTDSAGQAAEIQQLYVDNYNYGYYLYTFWQKTFYHFIQDYSPSDSANAFGLLDYYGNYRPAFYTYQTIYGR